MEQADAIFLAAQCSEGHEKNLCGLCQNFYGQRLSTTVSKCRPCASTAQIIALYAFAALASMCVIKVLCMVTAEQSSSAAAAAAAPTWPPNAGPGQAPMHKGGLCGCGSLAGDAAGTAKQHAQVQEKEHGPWCVKANCGGSSAAPTVAQRPSGASQPAGMTGTGGGSAAAGARAKPHSPPIGDLLKPFIIYLQVRPNIA